MVDTFGTGVVDDSVFEKVIKEVFDLTPNGIIESLDLRRPIYKKTATYGHFGRDIFSWEECNRVNDIKNKIG